MKMIKNIVCVASLLFYWGCSPKSDPGEPVNSHASLPESFGFSKMHLKVISSLINKKEGTMSVLYGNEKTVFRLRTYPDSITPGEQLTLLTWTQKEDGHWLGAKIPDRLRFAETVKTDLNSSGELLVKYDKYQGSQLVWDADTSCNANRTAFLLSQRPAVMP